MNARFFAILLTAAIAPLQCAATAAIAPLQCAASAPNSGKGITFTEDGDVLLDGKPASCKDVLAYDLRNDPKMPLETCVGRNKLPRRSIWPIAIAADGSLDCTECSYTLHDKAKLLSDLRDAKRRDPTLVISLTVDKHARYDAVAAWLSTIQQSGVRIDATLNIRPETPSRLP